MRPRVELALCFGILFLLGMGAALLGRRRNQGPSNDPRRSSYLNGPLGAKGLSDALEHLGVQVERFRRRTVSLEEIERLDHDTIPVLLFLSPSTPLDGAEANDIRRFIQYGDLVLAGPGAARAMRCFGFDVELRYGDSTPAVRPGTRPNPATPWVRAVLSRSTVEVVADSSRLADATVDRCPVESFAQADTLLVSGGGRLIAIRLWDPGRRARVTLTADGTLFSNQALRNTDAGPFALGLIAGRNSRAIFDEYHHGFGPSGGLFGATLAWSFRSAWGWAAWQLGAVGLIALLAGAIRFGPPIAGISRKRRSPLEHVKALATALAAAQGHDVAVGAIVRGLRRRLSPGGHHGRGEWRAWLAQLSANVRTPRAQDATRTLIKLTRPMQDAESVLRAANAVEDVWEELRP